MKTGTLVVCMTGAGILGGVVGAFVFLTLFADEYAPQPAEPTSLLSPLPADLQFSEAEAERLRRLPGQFDEMKAALVSVQRAKQGTSGGPTKGGAGKDAPSEKPLSAVERRANETRSIATLRNSTSVMAQVQASGKIDCDADGIGEYGTILELTGSVPLRTGNHGGSGDFSSQGATLAPALMTPRMNNVDANGMATMNGYHYRVFLPDTSTPAGFVHERGPANVVGLSGGTGQISIDYSETTWCMYAWPVKRGITGNRVFFVNQSGDVLQSANVKAKWSGSARAPGGNAAFTGIGITSRVAYGRAGNDGDVWKVTN